MLRAALWTDPIIVLDTVVFGTLSMLASLFDKTGRLQHRIARVWARVLVKAAGMRVEVDGLHHLDPGRSYVIACNHLSLLDIPVIAAHIPLEFRFFAKKSLFRIPFLGGHLRRAGHFPVVRDDPRQGLKLLSDAARQIRGRGVSVLIFPEGGRTQGELGEFKDGAAYVAIKAGVPLAPMGIAGTRACLPMGSLAVRPGPVRLRVGEPIETEGMRLQEHGALTLRLRQRVGELSGQALTLE
ncbi:MAG: lysophospholipid acyltransferase family protein [Bryobacteraceae bacterium]